MVPATTLIEVLARRAAERGPLVAYRFLATGDVDGPIVELSHDELFRAARGIGGWLQAEGGHGERVLLLYPSGLEFVSAFWGCLLGGAIAVPAYPPDPKRLERTLPRLRAIVADSGARFVFTTRAILELAPHLIAQAPELRDLRWIATDEISDDLAWQWHPPPVDGESLAFLQYTSGSTGTPKGVMVSHANLMANARMITQQFKHAAPARFLSWLPFYHDMGLIGIILQSVQVGGECTLMAPEAFLRRPMRWLQAMSHFKAQVTSAPNFGYELCVRKATDDEIARLDLSSWHGANNGAEPVRAATLARFAARFAPAGFRPEALIPCYGLAEATLLVAGTRWDVPAPVCTVSPAALEQGEVVFAADGRPLVPCGSTSYDQRIAIVDPVTRRACADGRVGEIWVQGSNVARGYWNRPDETEATFGARIADTDAGPYLRTGDLGFLHAGQLFITGRLKDLIIIRGRNHYPQDIEATVERSHPRVRPGCAAAFTVEVDGEERAVVVAEVDAKAGDPDEVAKRVRAAVAEAHALALHAVVLLPAGTIPKTSSGKIQRRACRAEYLGRTLGSIAWVTAPGEPPRPGRADEVIDWLRDYAGQRLNSALMDERRCIPPHVVLDLGNRGVLGLQVPQRLGGLGLGQRDTLRVCEQLAAIDLTLGMFVGVHVFLGTRPILTAAPEALRAELLPRIAQGRELAAFALTEPGAGSNPRALASVARPDGAGGWRLHGEKCWIGSAAWASAINVFARDEANGISGFVVRQGRPGLRMGPEAMTMGVRAMVQNGVLLEGVRVGAEDLLGAAGGGMAVAEDAMVQARIGLGAGSLGAMKRAVQLMLRYAQGRNIATGRLLDNPLTRTRLGEAMLAIAALERFVYAVADRIDAGRPVPAALATVCKIAGPELAGVTIDHMVQLLGGRGFIEPNGAAQMLRDARVLRIFEGPTETLQMHLGSQLLGDGGALCRFIEVELGAPGVAAALAADVEAVRERWQAAGVDGARWAALQVGAVASWAFLAATCPAERPERQWLTHRMAQARAAALDGRDLPEAERLARAIRDLARDIGDVDQTLPGADWAPDARLVRPTPRSVASITPIRPAAPARRIEQWIAAWLEKELKVTAVVPDRPFAEYGMDSLRAVELAQALEDWLGRPVDETVTWSYPTVAQLAAHLAGPARVEPAATDDLERALVAELAR
jgi:acyl-CoA synthetase (AMP-forming)/AMP-acid ligase II/alkylation response protein AidB-like acyl-CoA dehydrogenase/acyl carrier protein